MPKTLQQEIVSALMTYGVVTKKDLEKSLNPYATRKEVRKIVTEVVMDLTTQATDDVLRGIEKVLEDIPTRKEVVLKSDIKNLYTNINA